MKHIPDYVLRLHLQDSKQTVVAEWEVDARKVHTPAFNLAEAWDRTKMAIAIMEAIQEDNEE